MHRERERERETETETETERERELYLHMETRAFEVSGEAMAPANSGGCWLLV